MSARSCAHSPRDSGSDTVEPALAVVNVASRNEWAAICNITFKGRLSASNVDCSTVPDPANEARRLGRDRQRSEQVR